jgi:hypothetical protein
MVPGETSPWLSDEPVAPSLIKASLPVGSPSDAASGEAPRSPRMAYLPSRRFRPGDAAIHLELRLLADGRSALLAYSSLDSLVAGCGAAQPWVAVRTAADGLAELARLCGADEALWDVDIPADGRHGATDTEV